MTEQERPGTLAEALILLQSRLPRITKDTSGQYGKYANLASVHDAVLPLLIELDLLWVAKPTLDPDEGFVLAYQIRHIPSGESDSGSWPLPRDAGSQVQGSAVTYARRYSLVTYLGITPVGEDDDGQKAQDAHEARRDWHPPADPRTRRATRSRGTAAETTDWTTGPAGDDTPGSITDDQLAAIGDYWVSLGIPAEDRRPLVLAGSDETVNRIRDLSKTGGDKLIAYLRNLETSTEGGA